MVNWEKTEDLLRAAEETLIDQRLAQAIALGSAGAEVPTTAADKLGQTHLAILAIRDIKIPMHTRRYMRPS